MCMVLFIIIINIVNSHKYSLEPTSVIISNIEVTVMKGQVSNAKETTITSLHQPLTIIRSENPKNLWQGHICIKDDDFLNLSLNTNTGTNAVTG